MLAAAKDSVFLVEVGINAVKMRKTMTRGVLEVSEDQKREKAAVLVARLIRALDPIKVRMAIPFQAMESRVPGLIFRLLKRKSRTPWRRRAVARQRTSDWERSASLATAFDPRGYEARPVQWGNWPRLARSP